MIEQAVAAGHQGRRLALRRRAGPDRRHRRRVHQHHHRPARSRQGRGLYAVVDSGGKAGVIIFTDSIYAIAIAKSDATAEAIKDCARLQGARDRGHADRRPAEPHGAAHHVAAVEVRRRVDLLARGQRPLLRLHRRRRCSRPASTRRRAIRGKSPRATARCRRSSASATASTRSPPSPSRCTCRAGRSIDELNRAFAGEAPSGYVAPPHLFTPGQHRRRRRRPRTSSTRTTATATSTRRSGASSRHLDDRDGAASRPTRHLSTGRRVAAPSSRRRR